MSKDLEEHHVPIAPSALKSSFISGLGPDFHDIIKDFNRNKLDAEWEPLLIRDLIEPARSYLRLQQHLRTHHATYKSQTSTDSNNDTTQAKKIQPNQPKNDDKIAKDKNRKYRIVEAMKNKTFKIDDFTKEVGANECIFHGTSHPGTKNSSLECSKLKDLLTEFPQHSTDKTSKPSQPLVKPSPQPSAPPKAQQVNIPQQSDQNSDSLTISDDQEISNALNNLAELGNNLNTNNNQIGRAHV